MTEGEKRCGLASFLPMSCRGRAEAFARRLHNRLRTIGSTDHDTSNTSENTWLTSNNEILTNRQPRHSGTESDLLVNFSLFDSPGSPGEHEEHLTNFINITNGTNDEIHHHLNLEECGCIQRNSLDSDSSDGPFFDPEETGSFNHDCIIEEIQTDNVIGQDQFEDSLTQTDEEETSSECFLHFEQTASTENNCNNNLFKVIDLETLKHDDCCNSKEGEIGVVEEEIQEQCQEENSESYCSHLEIQNGLTVECPGLISPTVEISRLDSLDFQKKDEEEIQETDLNHLQVQIPELPDDSDTDLELELRVPRVRRCSSLKTGKTPPGTPGRKKIVRFADVLGLDLADVRTFLDEIPKVPISAYDDLSVIDDFSLSISETCSTLESSKTLVPLFQQPGGDTNFMDKLRSNQICLENVIVKDSIGLCVCGTVRVRNLDFNKSVHIRYTLDEWKSYADLQATYVENSCDGFSDKFSFTLYVHTLTIGQKFEFAVRYQCKGCQFWDNNGGVNYSFQCMPICTNKSYACAPVTVPDDTTWPGAAFY